MTLRSPKASFILTPATEPPTPSSAAPDGHLNSGRAAAPVGADELQATEAGAMIRVHKHVLHAPSSLDKVFLEMGRDRCQITVVYTGYLMGPRPYENHHESRSFGPVFLFPLTVRSKPGWYPAGAEQVFSLSISFLGAECCSAA